MSGWFFSWKTLFYFVRQRELLPAIPHKIVQVRKLLSKFPAPFGFWVIPWRWQAMWRGLKFDPDFLIMIHILYWSQRKFQSHLSDLCVRGFVCACSVWRSSILFHQRKFFHLRSAPERRRRTGKRDDTRGSPNAPPDVLHNSARSSWNLLTISCLSRSDTRKPLSTRTRTHAHTSKEDISSDLIISSRTEVSLGIPLIHFATS